MNAQKFFHHGSVLLVAVLGSALLTFANHGQITIQSFDTNGELRWHDPQGTGSHYAVQWASSPAGPWLSWADAVERLSSLGPTGEASVPLFYRVVNPDPQYRATETYSYFQSLPEFDPLTPLQEDEMRISFLGSTIPPPRRAQAEMSIFVEVGWIPDPSDPVYGGRARDQFVFDCGSGSSGNYNAMKIGFRRMDKVFITHLHADHMTDLCHIYGFGPSGDRKSPLYVFGPGPSGVESPADSGIYYEDGTKKFCENLRKALRWHSESFAFQSSSYASFERRNFQNASTGAFSGSGNRARTTPPTTPMPSFPSNSIGPDPALNPMTTSPITIPKPVSKSRISPSSTAERARSVINSSGTICP